MNTNQIEWFCAAYSSRSFAKASESSFVSRQAFTKAIKALEAEVGAELFSRTVSGIAPTEVAEAIYPLMKRMLNAHREITGICADLQLRERVTVRVAVADGIVESLPASFFDDLERACPTVAVKVEKHYYQSCMELLESGTVDFAICPGPAPRELSSIQLAHEDVFIGARTQDVPRAKAGAVELEDFADLRFYAVGEGSMGAMGLDEAFARHGMNTRIDTRYQEYNMILNKIRNDGGAVLIPISAARRADTLGLSLVPFPHGEIEWRALLLYEDGSLTPAKRAVVDCLRPNTA